MKERSNEAIDMSTASSESGGVKSAKQKSSDKKRMCGE